MGGMELYDNKQPNSCFYQDAQYSNCKYDQMLDYSMPNSQPYLGYNNMPYQEYMRHSPQHMPIHNNMFLDYCGSPVQSSSSEKMEIQFWNNHTHTFLENSRTRVQIQEQYVTFRKVSKLKSKSKKVCIYYRLKIIFNIQILCLIWVYS